MIKISAVIITLNEEQYIGQCLESLQGIADEIVVLDSYSTDQTQAICLRYGARFAQQAFSTYKQQKNDAIALAQYDYILSLDADECLSHELRQSKCAYFTATKRVGQAATHTNTYNYKRAQVIVY